jgi:predicted nucleic acid-binding protein
VTLVVDASAVVVALTDEGADGEWARGVMAQTELVAPCHLFVEVSSVLRRAVLAGRIGRDAAALAHEDLMHLGVTAFPFEGLAVRVWALHPRVVPYDAAYVALAEELSAPLLTLDRRLARADGPTCSFLLPPTASGVPG